METKKKCSTPGCQSAHYGLGFCEKHYQRFKKYGTPDDKAGDHVSLDVKFWPNVQFGSGCWTWKGPTYKGYGRVWWRGKTLRAHRASWLLKSGELPPDGLYVLHRCDNPSCVRPDHLFLGTNEDNAADRHAKGRDAHPNRRGILSGSNKLTESDVREIRASTKLQKEIAAEFGVDPSTVSDIRRRKSWPHI